jgi:heat shock protein HslJ
MATTRKAGPPELMMLETSYLKALVSTQQVGELGTIVWGGPFGSTRMAGPPELMELERRFLNALMRATHVRLTETGLGLEDEASGSVLV